MKSHEPANAHTKHHATPDTKKPVDLFEKCRLFTRADEIKATGLYPYFRPIEENEGPVVTIEGRKIIMAGSNNYLGLTADPRVKEAAAAAVQQVRYGMLGLPLSHRHARPARRA